MPTKQPDDSRIISLRLTADLMERLDRYLDWNLTHQGVKSTRNAAMREALTAWLNQQEQIAGLLDPATLNRQFQAMYDSMPHRHDGVPIHQLRQLLRWPRERFDAMLETLRAHHQVELYTLKETDLEPQVIQDVYHVHGQLYARIKWCD
jgi:hypothetical protein